MQKDGKINYFLPLEKKEEFFLTEIPKPKIKEVIAREV